MGLKTDIQVAMSKYPQDPSGAVKIVKAMFNRQITLGGVPVEFTYRDARDVFQRACPKTVDDETFEELCQLADKA